MANQEIELEKIASFLSALGAMMHSYAQTKSIAPNVKHQITDSLREILRLSQENEQKKLLAPVSGNRDTATLAAFLGSFSSTLDEYLNGGIIPPNYQTDLKTKLKELVNMGS